MIFHHQNRWKIAIQFMNVPARLCAEIDIIRRRTVRRNDKAFLSPIFRKHLHDRRFHRAEQEFDGLYRSDINRLFILRKVLQRHIAMILKVIFLDKKIIIPAFLLGYANLRAASIQQANHRR